MVAKLAPVAGGDRPPGKLRYSWFYYFPFLLMPH
jgi:hypothetical protein